MNVLSNARAWPNPAGDHLMIDLGAVPRNPTELLLLDASGSVVRSARWGSGPSRTVLDLSGLSPGCYTLMVRNAEGRFVQSVTVVR